MGKSDINLQAFSDITVSEFIELLSSTLIDRASKQAAEIVVEKIEAILEERWKTKYIDKEYISTRECAELIGVSSTTIYDWINKGRLKAYKAGSRTRFKTKEVLSIVKKLEPNRA